MTDRKWEAVRDPKYNNAPLVRYPILRRACEGRIMVSVVGLADEQMEQAERLAGWISRIAPDGVIPPVPAASVVASLQQRLEDAWDAIEAASTRGEDVAPLEHQWLMLMKEYERLTPG